MNSFNRSTHDFRTTRKWFPMTGCLIFVLLMTQAACRPSETDDALAYSDGDYTDADDIEWQNFPFVETTTKEHPIVYYKEDIVNEDYDPNTDNKSPTTASGSASTSKESKQEAADIKPLIPRRRYKEIIRHNRLNRTERYRYIKPDKVYFDIYPVEYDSSDSKINDDDDVHVEVVSLLEADDVKTPELKRLLAHKRSKKYSRRHRQRRDLSKANTSPETAEAEQHALRHKRNPYISRHTYYRNQLPNYHGVVVYTKEKHPVRGIYINPFSPGAGRLPSNRRKPTTASITPLPDITDRINLDGVDQPQIWDSKPLTTKPPRRPPPPIVNSGDEDFVPPPSPVGRNPNLIQPEAQNFIPAARPSFPQTTTPRPLVSAASSSRGVSACIWAISSCCTRTSDIRYQCFERLGCHGAFWDFNPCADDIFQLAVSAADEYLS